MPDLVAASSGWGASYGSVPASSIGATVTANASANTKGAVVELVAATDQDAHWIGIAGVAGSSSGVTGLLDILIGSSSEATLIANLPVSTRGAHEGGVGQILFPLFVPKGSRLSAAFQSAFGGSTLEVVVQLFGGAPLGPLAGCTYVDRYGATATSRGTNVDPGGVAHTYLGSMVEITASTLRPIRWLVLAIQNIDAAFAAVTAWTVQLGIGSATEQQLGGDFIFVSGVTLDNAMPFMHYYLPIFIPQGSRLAVNAKCNSTTDGDRDLYVSLFGAG
jgi:hypothetical protein